MKGPPKNERDHFAAKIMSAVAGVDLIGYVSFDDTHEDNYQRVYSAADFAAYPEWDQLTGEWTGISYIDQSYRRAWSTLRENFFAYLKAEKAFDNGLTLNGAIYRHDNDGRGDWVPPGLQNVRDDAGGPQTEYTGSTPFFGDRDAGASGAFFFVDAAGNALAPAGGCVSSLTFPYGGGPAAADPACYPVGSIPVGSLPSYALPKRTHRCDSRLHL